MRPSHYSPPKKLGNHFPFQNFPPKNNMALTAGPKAPRSTLHLCPPDLVQGHGSNYANRTSRNWHRGCVCARIRSLKHILDVYAYMLGVSSNSNWGAFFRLGMLVRMPPNIPLSISQKYPSVSQKYPSVSPKNTPQYLPKIPLSISQKYPSVSQKYPSVSPKNTPQYLPKIPFSISQEYPSAIQTYSSFSPKNSLHYLPKTPFIIYQKYHQYLPLGILGTYKNTIWYLNLPRIQLQDNVGVICLHVGAPPNK